MSDPYMVYAYYCDVCKIQMPPIADEAVGNAESFVRSEMQRHAASVRHLELAAAA